MTETRASRRAGAYMHEVDGIRGIALTLVVLFHVFGNGRVSGGVDVFLVISAYFLTRKLLKHFDASTQAPESFRAEAKWLGKHYTGVISRLVPSIVVVLGGVLVATWLFARPSQYLQNLRETVASLLYYENWELISSQLAYEAAGPATSPLQHFWSLSVQGQFFLFWPLIAFALFFVARRFGGTRWAVLAVVVLVTVASFAYALFLVGADQQVAYFHTFSRLWELGAGAMIVFLPARFLAFGWVKETAVRAGIAMIVASGFLFDGASLFPGVATLWPVAGTLLALFGASRDTSPGFSATVLSTAPVRFLARISYQLYLWHWPILVFYLQVREQSRVGLLGAAIVLSLSLILAVITQWLVSRAWIVPPDKVFRWRSLLVAATGAAVILSVSLVWTSAQLQQQQLDAERAEELAANYIGSQALSEPASEPATSSGEAETALPPFPAFDAAYLDRPTIYAEGCIQDVSDAPGTSEVLVCDNDNYGATKTVVLTGGSHAVQWYPALQKIAQQEGWRLLVIEKNGCRLRTDSQSASCAAWNEQAVDVIASYSPDLVFTLGTVSGEKEGRLDKVDPNTVPIWQELSDRGITVMGIRDTPRLPFKVPDCLEEHDGDTAACTYPTSDIYSEDPLANVDELPGSFVFIDLRDAISPRDRFEPIVGNVVVYRDHSHMTATFAETTAPSLELAMREAYSEIFVTR